MSRMVARAIGLATLGLVFGCGGSSEDTDAAPTGPDPSPVHWALGDTFYPIAHRGGALIGPENTLEALQLSVDAGIEVVEIDLFMTSDGHVVLLHDETVDRTTDGTGRIQDMTLAEAQALDAGYAFTLDDGATYPFRGQGVRIPTWEQALADFPSLYWDVEVKQTDPPIFDAVVASIEAAGVQDRVFIACFDDAAVRAFRADYPDWVTNMGETEYAAWTALAEDGEADYDPPGEIAQIWDVFYNDSLPAKADRTGVALHVWTVNDRDLMAELLAEGVDGIITDDPVMLLEVMAEQGL